MNEFLLSFIIFLVVAGVVVVLWQKKLKVDRIQSEAIRDLERRVTDLVLEIKGSVNDTSRAMHEQISSFTKEAVQIREDLRQVQEVVKDVSSFQDIFRSPKLRGQWGEASLEHILSNHFPPDLYQRQYLFSSGEQVDAILRLPNGRLLPIDAKFPSENFAKMIEVSEEERKFYQKKFIEDVKFRINEIASKYILPSEKTVDFALMYIPAEAIYYEIINNIGRELDITSFAWSKKVILTSPNTIYLTLRTIEHWFRDTQISRQTQNILGRLAKIHQDAKKLMDDFRKLGSHLRNAASAYSDSEKRLSLLDDRVEKLVEIGERKKLKEPEKEES